MDWFVGDSGVILLCGLLFGGGKYGRMFHMTSSVASAG